MNGVKMIKTVNLTKIQTNLGDYLGGDPQRRAGKCFRACHVSGADHISEEWRERVADDV